MIDLLQILVSVLFFVNKVLVLAEKKVGWVLGMIGAVLAVFYFYAIDLRVYTALEFGLIALMGYAFFKKEGRNPTVEMWIRLVTGVVMIALAYFAWSGFITAVEFASSIGLLVATYMLTHGYIQQGWAVYMVSHILTAYLGFAKDQLVFAWFQIASAVVAVVGIVKFR